MKKIFFFFFFQRILYETDIDFGKCPAFYLSTNSHLTGWAVFVHYSFRCGHQFDLLIQTPSNFTYIIVIRTAHNDFPLISVLNRNHLFKNFMCFFFTAYSITVHRTYSKSRPLLAAYKVHRKV